MKEYKIYLDNFMIDFFYIMEKIQDGKECHIVMFEGETKEEAAKKVAERLIPFIKANLIEVVE